MSRDIVDTCGVEPVMEKQKNLVIVRSVLDQGLTVAAAAAKYDLSRQWIYTLLAQYRAGGAEALEPGSRTPRRRPSATAEPLRQRILELRRQLQDQGADAGAETIAWHLEREGMPPPSRATIHRNLRTAGLISPEPRKRPKSSLQRFEAALPNETWQADITHWPLQNGSAADVLDFLDDHSRYLLHLQAYRPCTGADVVEAMNALIKHYGAPASTLTDNGMVFTSRFASRPGARNGFETLLATHRIQQKNGSPGHPQTQGKIERFHQTLKRWLARRPLAPDLPTLQLQLEDFRHWYNCDRPHRAIGRRTPATAYTALPKAVPESTPTQSYRTRTDRVDTNGKVSLRHAGQLRHLGIGRAHTGAPVLLLIHDNHVTTTHSGTGEIIAEHHIDPNRDYQPKLRHH